MKCRRKGFSVVSKTFALLAAAKAIARAIERAFDLEELPDDLQPAAPAEPTPVKFTTLQDILVSYRDEACPPQKAGDLATMKINLWLAEPFVQTKLTGLKAVLSTWRDKRLTQVKPGTVLRE